MWNCGMLNLVLRKSPAGFKSLIMQTQPTKWHITITRVACHLQCQPHPTLRTLFSLLQHYLFRHCLPAWLAYLARGLWLCVRPCGSAFRILTYFPVIIVLLSCFSCLILYISQFILLCLFCCGWKPNGSGMLWHSYRSLDSLKKLRFINLNIYF